MTVNRFCGSSMSSVHIAAGQIQLGAGEAFICAGVESASTVTLDFDQGDGLAQIQSGIDHRHRIC
jgi:acetyl-CoA acetyltransferase